MRPKKHKSNAEKQKAYRLRKEAESLGIPRQAVRNPKRFSSTQGEWEKKNGYERIDEAASPHDSNTKYFLIKKTKDNLFYIRILSATAKEMLHSFSTEDKARVAFEDLKLTGLVSADWYTIEHYEDEAKRIIIDGDADSPQIHSTSNRYGLIFAIYQYACEGFTFQGALFNKISPAGEEHNYSRLGKLKRLLYAIGNKEIPGSHSGIQSDVRNGLYKIIEKYSDKRAVVSEKTVSEWGYIVGAAFRESAVLHPDLFGKYHVLGETIPKKITTLISTNIQDSAGEGKVKHSKNHPWIPVDKLNKILEIAFETNIELYHFCLLSLTTGIRPEDMDLVAHYKTKFLNSDGTLNYRHENPPPEVEFKPIGGKTWKKVNRASLNNPMLSIIGRIIMHYHNPRLMPENFFQIAPDKRCVLFRNRFKDLKPYYERAMRTTCAKMILYCAKASNGIKTTINDAQDRLAHATIETTSDIYAKNYPSAMSPEKYFGIEKLKIRDTVVSEKSVLWDTYLLNDYYERHLKMLEASGDAVAIRRLQDRIISESKKYNSNYG